MCLGLPELVTVRWRMIWTQALMALHWGLGLCVPSHYI